MNGRIIHATAATALGQCRHCRQSVPLQQLSELGCLRCWAEAGAKKGFTLMPQGYVMMRQADALLLSLVMKLLEPHVDERGGEEDALKCLARLLEERRQMAQEHWPHAPSPVACCYCGEPGPIEEEAGVALESLDWAQRLPDLWRCSDVQMCLRRLLARLQPAEAPPRGGVS
jgi:hypothetical protein